MVDIRHFINDFPLEKIKINATADRRIGLGIMGLHYAMLKNGIKYSSDKGIEFTEKIYEIFKKTLLLLFMKLSRRTN